MLHHFQDMLILAVVLFINLLLGKPGSGLIVFNFKVSCESIMNQINRQIIEITGAETRDLRSDDVRLMHVRRKS